MKTNATIGGINKQRLLSYCLFIVLLLGILMPIQSILAETIITEVFESTVWELREFGKYKYSVHNGITTEAFDMLNKATGTSHLGYCLDYEIDALLAEYHSYPANALDHLPYPVDFAKVKAVMHYGFNGNNLAELRIVAGSSLTAAEATRATQLALWALTSQRYVVTEGRPNRLKLFTREYEPTTVFGTDNSSDARVYTLFKYLMNQPTIETATRLPVEMKIANMRIDMSGAVPRLLYDINLTGTGVSQLDKITAQLFEGANVIASGAGEHTSLSEGVINISVPLNGYTNETVQNKTFRVVLKTKQTYQDYYGLRYMVNGQFAPLRAQTCIAAEKTNGSVLIEVSNALTVLPVPQTSVTFSKIAAGQGEELPGAEITVSGTDILGNSFTETWTSTDTAKVLQLKAGTYTMTENQAPLGYNVAAEIEFRVNLDGSVEINQNGDWVSAQNATIQMVDELRPNGVTFSKVAAGQGEELEGAELKVVRKDGTLVESWTSTGTAKVLDLPAGEYKMVEDQAPLGYNVAAEIEFRVNLDGSVEINQNGDWVSAQNATIQMVDELKPNGVTFSKVAAGQGEELAGAELKVIRKDGTLVESWTSTGTAKVLQLTAGEYRMVEDQAPLGYNVAAEIEFRVNLDGTVEIKEGDSWVPANEAKVQMVDELKPTPTPPPSTPSYDPINVPLSASKTLVNGALKEGQFAFELLAGNGKLIETISNDASGQIHFTDRRFSKTGTFIYTIREVKGDNAKITYDSTVYRVIIRTTAVGGKLTAKVDYEKDGVPYGGDVKFVNRVEMPKTGDSHLLLPLYLTILSLVMFGGVTLLRRKQEYRK